MTTFYFHPKISWKKFKKINDALYKGKDTGPTPLHQDLILWKGLKDRSFNVGVDTTSIDDPVFISTKKLPKSITLIK